MWACIWNLVGALTKRQRKELDLQEEVMNATACLHWAMRDVESAFLASQARGVNEVSDQLGQAYRRMEEAEDKMRTLSGQLEPTFLSA